MKRPWAGLGIGWILAVLALIIVVLVLLHAIAGSTFLIWVCLGLLALALLL